MRYCYVLVQNKKCCCLLLQTSFDDMPEAYTEGPSFHRGQLARPALTRLATHFSLSYGLQELPLVQHWHSAWHNLLL